jgi:NADPH-dependent 2,4-dienoyl-CoA reductase/sulfur reductase-like enzyme
MKLVVIGADAAGMSAARQALRGATARGLDLNVTVLERTQDTSYSACGIPYWLAGDVANPQQLVAQTAEEHRALGIDLRLGTTATSLDLGRHVVTYRDARGSTDTLWYDELVLATGAVAEVPAWARNESGELLTGVHPVKNLQDGAIWLELLAAKPAGHGGGPRRAVIVGGGYIALEMAEAMLRRGLHTTVITRGQVMSSLDPDMGGRITTAMTDSGVAVLAGQTVTSISVNAAGSVESVTTDAGHSLPADVVVLAAGVRPNSSMGAEAGIAVGAFGGYLPDPTGRVAQGVWAAGDCCEVFQRITGQRAFLPLGTHANKMGRSVGENLTGGNASFGGALGTAITRFAVGPTYLEISRTGLNEAQAQAAGLEAVSLVTASSTASGYMPEAEPIATKLTAERRTRRLLGAQIVGGHGAGKRIDAVAVALWGEMSIDDLASMDLSYAPPFATAWDSVQLAARRLSERM